MTQDDRPENQAAAALVGPPISRIGVGVDSYPEGRDATVLAAAIAEATGAELMLLAVEPDLPLIIPGLERKRVRRETEAMLRETSDHLAPNARRKIDSDLSIPRGLERLVRAEHRDLIVVGSSRHGHNGTVTIGRLTRQLLSDLHTALAVAPRGLSADHGARTRLRLRRIGVGYDGGPEARAALAAAATISAGAGAELVVRGAIDDRVPALGWPKVWMGAILDSWVELMDEEERLLRESIDAALQECDAEAAVQIERGRPSRTLIALSDEVDLLVIGSRRWGPIARLLLGGTAEALVHHGAHCSLLVVPRPDDG